LLTGLPAINAARFLAAAVMSRCLGGNIFKNLVPFDPLVLADPYRGGIHKGYPGTLPKATGL